MCYNWLLSCDYNFLYLLFRCDLSGIDGSGFGSILGNSALSVEENFIGNLSTQAVLNLISFANSDPNQVQTSDVETVSISAADVSQFAVPNRVLADVTNQAGEFC